MPTRNGLSNSTKLLAMHTETNISAARLDQQQASAEIPGDEAGCTSKANSQNSIVTRQKLEKAGLYCYSDK